MAFAAALLGLATPAAPSQEADAGIEERRQDLADVEDRLRDIEQDLEARRTSRGTLIGELERHERDIGQLARAGRELEGMMQEQSRVLSDLHARVDAERRALEQERAALAGLLRSAYTLGDRESMRLLLDQEDLARIGRAMSYYGYLNRYRVRRIEALAERSRALESLRLEAAEEAQRLATLASRQEGTMRRLARSQEKRAALLADLELTIATREERAAGLRSDAKGLRLLIEQLERKALELPEADLSQEAIGQLRGRLDWPVAGGRLIRRFGRPKGDSGQRWDGVLIAAEEGTEVRAVHHGRVAYADWLRGFGLLMIIEHDDEYMTLYGHNQTLLKEAGEWVAAADVIALSGTSGGQRKQGLYFAIRRRGTPIDPEPWCRVSGGPGVLGDRAATLGMERPASSPLQTCGTNPAARPCLAAAKPGSAANHTATCL